ncbi:foldase protein PrsA [Paenibacillus sp. CAU 1782]
MNNNDSQSNSKKTDLDDANKERYEYEGDEQGGHEANASEPAQENQKGDLTASAEKETAASAATAAPSHYSAANTLAAAAPARKGSVGWIALSAVLAVVLVVVLIKPPFGESSGASGDVVATVNGTKITKDQLYDKLVSANGEAALDSIILEELVNQEAKAANITVTDQDITDEINALKLNYGTDEAFDNLLLQYGITMEDLREDMVINATVRKVLESKTEVTDEEVQAYFDENKATLGGSQEQVRASHILVATKEEAEAILADLKAGADFAETAKAKSTDTGSGANGGDLDFFTRADMVTEFSDAAFALENGELSDVVESQYGFHIIKRTDYKAAVEPNFEDKKSAIRTYLVGQEVSGLSQAWIEEIRAKAKITNTLTPEASADPAASDEPAASPEAKE